MADYSILIYLVVALSMIMVGVSKGGGLHEKAFILVGVGPLRSECAAEFMCTKVPGVIIPDVLVEPLRKTPKRHKRAEGKRICVEIIQQVREIEGVVVCM